MIDFSPSFSSRTWLLKKFKIQNFLPFFCIFLTTKQTKTHTKSCLNLAILTQSTNKIQTTVRSKTQNQNPKPILINKIHQNTSHPHQFQIWLDQTMVTHLAITQSLFLFFSLSFLLSFA